jgi:hypothetical protein
MRVPRNFGKTVVTLCIGAIGLGPVTIASAQGDSFRSEIFAGSVPENYLRYLQTMGLVPLYPWTSRPFSPSELDRLIPRDSAHPWAGRLVPTTIRTGAFSVDVVRPNASFRYNTGFAYGSNDGPIWAGRGLTSAFQVGVAARFGPASLTLAPMIFRAENRYYFIAPNGKTGLLAFGNATHGGVDLPQRFGDGAYQQLDPGQSTLRIDLPGIAVGASTANMTWGPGTEYPLLLSNNAAGFPHAFVSTSAPLNVFVAKLNAKIMWGRLAQSKYSFVTGSSEFVNRDEPGRKRFATGIVVSAQPAGINGLEFGAARFFHSIWPSTGIPSSYYTKALEAFTKSSYRPDSTGGRGIPDNQLLEVFLRWVFPRSGAEFSFEYGREDHAEIFRELIEEPDHSRFYNLGFRKVISLNAQSMTAARVEIINSQKAIMDRYRPQGETYLHGMIRQGHTQRGQLLGANIGVGAAAGSTVAVDHYWPGGMWTAKWTRDLRDEIGDYQFYGVERPRSMDVTHSLGFEMTRYVRHVDLTTGLTFVRDFNRYNIIDASNINAIVGVRYNMR